MKVILRKDIARLGKKHDVVDVPDGRARNHLVPNGLAEVATNAVLKQLAQKKAADAAKEEEAHAAWREALNTLRDTTVTISADANEKGHLFKGLHERELAERLSAHAGVTIAPEHVHIDAPIKETGEHTLTLRMGEESETVTVRVEAS